MSPSPHSLMPVAVMVAAVGFTIWGAYRIKSMIDGPYGFIAAAVALLLGAALSARLSDSFADSDKHRAQIKVPKLPKDVWR